MIEPADLQAAFDVLHQFNEEIEDLDATECVRYSKLVDEVFKEAKLAAEFLKTRTLSLIESQPLSVDGAVYVRKAVKKWRPNQRKIQSVVAMRSVCDLQTGEVVTEPLVAAAQAVTLMYDLFVSPSAMPKQGGLAKLGLTNRDIAEQETTGHDLKKIEVEADND